MFPFLRQQIFPRERSQQYQCNKVFVVVQYGKLQVTLEQAEWKDHKISKELARKDDKSLLMKGKHWPEGN